MIEPLLGFVALLRQNGLTIGPDRTLLAARSLEFVDLADRSAVQRSLRITLVTHRDDEALFDELYGRWFDAGALLDDPAPTGVDDQRSGPMHRTDAELTLDTERRLHDAVYVDDPSQRLGVTSDRAETGTGTSSASVIDRHGDPVEALVDTDTIVGRRVAQVSDSTSTTTRPPTDEPTRIVLPSDPDDDERGGTDRTGGDVEQLVDQLLDRRRRHLGRFEPSDPSVTSSINRSTTVLANPFDQDEQQMLQRVVAMIRPQLSGGTSWRRRAADLGAIDLRRTLRRTITTAGVPIHVQRRSTTSHRARLVVLVDTSLSVRPSARLMLHLAHQLRRQVGSVRVFAFIDRCVEVTDVIRHSDLPTALGDLLDDQPGGPLDPARSSDYGSAFHSLRRHHRSVFDARSTMFVLGDGRSNGRDPATEWVRDLTASCRRTIWLTPEPEGAWAFGHGEMAGYAEAVDVAWTVRSLDHLLALARSGRIRPPVHARRSTPRDVR